MKITPQFPEHRRQDPLRLAELRVYTQIAESLRRGHALYEVKAISSAPELDFAVWVEGCACFGLQVKGGQHTVDGLHWFLHTVDGTEPIPCPIQQTWDAALSIKTAIKRRLGRRTYILPVLVFPDMLPDPEIQQMVESDGRVSVLWGEENLIDRLMELPETDNVFTPPDAGQIVSEIAAVRPSADFTAADVRGRTTSPGKPYPAPAGPVSATERGRMDLTARQVVIQRADVVNVYTVDPNGEPNEDGD